MAASLDGSPENHAMDEVLDDYRTYLGSWQASEATVRGRMTLAKSRFRAWGVDGFTPERVAAFLATDIRGKPRMKWTVATYHNHLTDLCEFLVAGGYLDDSPMTGIKRVKRPAKKPRPLVDGDVDRVLSVVDGRVRDWLLIALLSGLRAFEIAKLRGEDFSEAGLYVVGKGGVEATLPIHPDLEAMRERYPTSGHWFPGPQDGHVNGQRISLMVGTLFESLTIEGSIHRCRHTYATRLLRAGVNIRVVQRLMRHSSLETTAGYLSVMGDEERDAVLLLTASSPHVSPAA